MSNNQTKELEQKIEEIMSKGTWEEAGDFYNMYFVLEHDFPKLLTLISQSQVEAVEGFVRWLKERNSEDRRYLICPKCENKEEYWGRNQEPLYCSGDGRKMVLKTERVVEHDSVSIYDLETELTKEYLDSLRGGGEMKQVTNKVIERIESWKKSKQK